MYLISYTFMGDADDRRTLACRDKEALSEELRFLHRGNGDTSSSYSNIVVERVVNRVQVQTKLVQKWVVIE